MMMRPDWCKGELGGGHDFIEMKGLASGSSIQSNHAGIIPSKKAPGIYLRNRMSDMKTALCRLGVGTIDHYKCLLSFSWP